MRRILAREGPVEYEGEEYRLPVDPEGLGKPLKLMIRPVRERIPIYLGAIGPKAIEQAAEIADGWMPFMFTPDTAAELLRPFEGRDVDVAPVVMACVDDDLERARDLARPWLAVYLGGMGARGKNFYVETAERFGQGEMAREVQRLFLAGDRAGAAAALSPELIDATAICCRPGELDERLAAYERRVPTCWWCCPSATARRSSTRSGRPSRPEPGSGADRGQLTIGRRPGDGAVLVARRLAATPCRFQRRRA